ncbi:unnamed protein product [Nezara viridula]|uniref:Uncharacterized protein n=1 Tax=Nezara viridula TaxID=85310 RepID=A0A9P0HHW3_NEZVI|nr:unnamed protein product [Nezara viridula]
MNKDPKTRKKNPCEVRLTKTYAQDGSSWNKISIKAGSSRAPKKRLLTKGPAEEMEDLAGSGTDWSNGSLFPEFDQGRIPSRKARITIWSGVISFCSNSEVKNDTDQVGLRDQECLDRDEYRKALKGITVLAEKKRSKKDVAWSEEGKLLSSSDIVTNRVFKDVVGRREHREGRVVDRMKF